MQCVRPWRRSTPSQPGSARNLRQRLVTSAFEGTPIPTTAVLTGILALAAWQDRLGEQLYGGVWTVGPGDLHPLSLMFVLSGTLMISKTLRIPKL